MNKKSSFYNKIKHSVVIYFSFACFRICILFPVGWLVGRLVSFFFYSLGNCAENMVKKNNHACTIVMKEEKEKRREKKNVHVQVHGNHMFGVNIIQILGADLKIRDYKKTQQLHHIQFNYIAFQFFVVFFAQYINRHAHKLVLQKQKQQLKIKLNKKKITNNKKATTVNCARSVFMSNIFVYLTLPLVWS